MATVNAALTGPSLLRKSRTQCRFELQTAKASASWQVNGACVRVPNSLASHNVKVCQGAVDRRLYELTCFNRTYIYICLTDLDLLRSLAAQLSGERLPSKMTPLSAEQLIQQHSSQAPWVLMTECIFSEEEERQALKICTCQARCSCFFLRNRRSSHARNADIRNTLCVVDWGKIPLPEAFSRPRQHCRLHCAARMPIMYQSHCPHACKP